MGEPESIKEEPLKRIAELECLSELGGCMRKP